ncbi:MAG: hypothetical protein GW859_09295 [Sphingomonadales bacterium]|nr:hypothetical protein [Sphingomonadales bacterium]
MAEVVDRIVRGIEIDSRVEIPTDDEDPAFSLEHRPANDTEVIARIDDDSGSVGPADFPAIAIRFGKNGRALRIIG